MPKSTDKNSLVVYRRILRMDELFSSNRYPTWKDLVADESIAASRTTVFRTIEFMKDQLHAPIIYDNAHGGYCYEEKTFRLPALFTTKQEVFAATLLQNMAAKLKGTPLYNNALSLLDYIQNETVRNPNEREFSNDSSGKENTGLNWSKDRYVFLGASNFSVENETWTSLERAMKANRQIEFDYYWQKGNKKVKILFEPYQVVNSSGRWYVWGFDAKTKSKRFFLLDLISGLRILPHDFKLPADYDVRNSTNGVFGAYVGDKEYNFKAKFSDWSIPYIKRVTWGKDQTITEGKDDSITLSFTGSELLPFLNVILSYGKYAQPLAPKELVNLWKENIQESTKRIEGN